MKTRNLLVTMWVGLVIVALTLGLVSVGVLLDNRQLRQEGRDLRTSWDDSRAEATALKDERASIQEELGAQRQKVEELSAQLAELKVRTEAKEAPVGQQAYRIRAYLNNQWVSQGWLVPGQATTNGNGQLVYDPVVVLDPSARTAMSDSPSNEVVPAEQGSVTINHNYPAQYDGVWPGVWVWSTGQKHRRPGQHSPESPRSSAQPQPQPQPVSPYLSTRVWQPRNGWQQMAPGRPGGEWISSAPRGLSYLSNGGGSRSPSLPVRY